jgi:c-di-GMP-related signal transduction protein
VTARKPSPGPTDDQVPSNYESAAPEYVYLGRQPILDRSGALNAFELLFRSGAANFAQVTDDADATAQVIARLIGDMGPRAVLGNHTGYVNVDRMVLMSDIVQLLAPERFVLEILETVTFDEALFKRCSELPRGLPARTG